MLVLEIITPQRRDYDRKGILYGVRSNWSALIIYAERNPTSRGTDCLVKMKNNIQKQKQRTRFSYSSLLLLLRFLSFAFSDMTREQDDGWMSEQTMRWLLLTCLY